MLNDAPVEEWNSVRQAQIQQKEFREGLNKDKQVGGDHYQMPIQPIEFIVANSIEYRAGNVIKYVVRHGKKNGKEDLLKARHYLDMIIQDYNS